MKRLWLLLIACCLMVSGCGPSGPIQIPDPVRVCRLACELADGGLEKVSSCLLLCGGQTPAPRATATIRPTATVTPTAAPTVTPTTAPASETAVPVGGECVAGAGRGVFADQVSSAEDVWLSANTDKWKQRGAQRNVAPEFWNAYYFGVVSELIKRGLAAVVDNCGGQGICGEIAVAAVADAAFHEQYAILISSGDVRPPMNGNAPNGFRAVCRPRGFSVGVLSPTATPAPAAATCPPLLTIDIFKLGGASKFQGPNGWCQIINFTPRFLVDGKNRPCNGEHPWCGEALGETCEPRPDQVVITVHSGAGIFGMDKDYLSKACGADGSMFDATATLVPGAVDKAGRPVDVSQFAPFRMTGAI